MKTVWVTIRVNTFHGISDPHVFQTEQGARDFLDDKEQFGCGENDRREYTTPVEVEVQQ